VRLVSRERLALVVLQQEKNKFLKARGPFASRSDAITCALRINPGCEIVSWDGYPFAAPNLITPLPAFVAA
jgi:hypothetical protein